MLCMAGQGQTSAPPAPEATAAPQPQPGRARRVAGDVLISVFCLISVTAAVVFADTRAVGVAAQEAGEIAPLTIPSLLVGWGLVVLLWWRRRMPWIVFGICAAVTLLLWLDSSAVLFAMVPVLARATRPWQTVLATVVGLATTITALWRDTRGFLVNDQVQTSVWNWSQEAWPMSTVLIVAVLLTGVFLASGIWLRSRRTLRKVSERHQQAEEQVRNLDHEVQRRVERERISREVHDALGHRLSLLSMQAGALEFTAADKKVADQAAQLRENAQQAMVDLRALLDMLQESADTDVAQTPHSIDDVPALVDEALAHGAPVVAAMAISESETLNPVVSHSAYRITQELLTNARKHAPGVTVRLNVTGNPGVGVEIAAANHISDEGPPDDPLHPGRGLVSINERAEQCGGACRYWVDADGVFRVAVRLPWELREA